MKGLFILREDRNAQALYAFLRANWKACVAQGKPLAVQITDAKAKRSTQANRYYRAVLQQIEEQAWVEGRQFSADAWHEMFKRQFIGFIDLPGGGVQGQSSTTLNTEEFNIYTQRVEAYAATELGVQFVELAEPTGRIAA